MLFCTIAFMVAFGAEDENDTCLICYAEDPKYQVSCCGYKVCSECVKRLKNDRKCPNCRQSYRKERVLDWKGEEKPRTEMSPEEQKNTIQGMKNKNHLDLELQQKHTNNRMKAMNNKELRNDFRSAARTGNLEILKTIRESQFESRIPNEYFGTAWKLAAFGGHLEVLKYLRESVLFDKCTAHCLGSAWKSAANAGNLEVLKFLSQPENRFSNIDTQDLFEAATNAKSNVETFLSAQFESRFSGSSSTNTKLRRFL